MVRILILIATILLAFSVSAGNAAEAPDWYKLRTGIDISYINSSGYTSWTEGLVGKLRYDDNHEGLMISRAFADYEFQLADTLKGHAAVEAYDDDIGSRIDFTQAYVEWRPVPRSENRYRLKLGVFYPRISLENVSAGWSSPYSMSSSAINTWVAEELRTVGAELSVSRRPVMFGGAHTFSLQGAVFLATIRRARCWHGKDGRCTIDKAALVMNSRWRHCQCSSPACCLRARILTLRRFSKSTTEPAITSAVNGVSTSNY